MNIIELRYVHNSPNFMAHLEAETWCGDLEKNPDALKVPSDPTAQALKRSCSS